MENVGSPSSQEQAARLLKLSRELLHDMAQGMDMAVQKGMSEAEQRAEIQATALALLRQRSMLLAPRERDLVVKMVLDEVFGWGPLEELIHDSAVTDILINGPNRVYVERGGTLSKANVWFEDEKHLMRLAQRAAGKQGRLLDESHPMVDTHLPDGSRFNAIAPPLARKGPYVSIRRFPVAWTPRQMVEHGSLTWAMLFFLRACVLARLNILVSGGTGSGKTTLLNALSRFIPETERVVTIEDAAELQLAQDHVLTLESRPPNIEGVGAVSQRDLLRNALRMRPDRIVVGECRGGEAVDMLQAMNTGHDGSLTTIHANSARDALVRLEMLVELAGLGLPARTIRRQIASGIQIVVQVARLRGGPRKVMSVTEIVGFDGEDVLLRELFRFQQTNIDAGGQATGEFQAVAAQPFYTRRFEECGVPYRLNSVAPEAIAEWL